MTCSANFGACGYSVGKTYSLISGWGLNPIVTNVHTEITDPHLFIDGIVDGFAKEELVSIRDNFNTFLGTSFRYVHGDFGLLNEVLDQYVDIKKQITEFTHPVSYTKVLTNMAFENSAFMTRVANFEACEDSRRCGVILGDLLAFLLN